MTEDKSNSFAWFIIILKIKDESIFTYIKCTD